jgi:serine/threonine protein kinase
MARKFNLNEFDIMQTLGTGSFGRVKLARVKASGEFVALKILKKAEILRLKQVDHVISEFSILRTIHHPFLVNLVGYTQDDRYLYLGLEFIAGGELFTYLRNIGRLETPHAKYYSAQISLMFEYMHSLNIIYRDLKPENLLINPDGYLKLTDFGFAKVVEGRTYTLCGTPEYLAPEILLNKGHGKPVDWWTLGVIIYEMLAGIDPFADDDPMSIYQKILKGKIKFPRNFDKNGKSLVKHLLVADLTKRFGNLKNKASDIKNHRFFAGLDWQRLINKGIEMPYRPLVKSAGDATNFSHYPESLTLSPPLKHSDDPFLNW